MFDPVRRERKPVFQPTEAYLAEVRAYEDEFFNRPHPDGRTNGESAWGSKEGIKTLHEIGRRHGVAPDSQAFSILAYKAEMTTIEREFDQACLNAPGNRQQLSIRHAARSADCAARRFPGLSRGSAANTKWVDTLPKLWMYIRLQILASDSIEDRLLSAQAPATHSAAMPDVPKVYDLLRRFGLARLAPRPPFPRLTPSEARVELAQIAEKLEAMESRDLILQAGLNVPRECEPKVLTQQVSIAPLATDDSSTHQRQRHDRPSKKPRAKRDEGKDDKCVCVYLRYVARNETPPGATAIAEEVGCSVSTASRAIKKWEDKRRELALEDARNRYGLHNDE
jgi:hypothetical protein